MMTAARGTPHWAAPEVLAPMLTGKKKANYSLSADIYSLGVIMWEIATRKTPFAELEFISKIVRHVVAGGRPIMAEETVLSPLIRRCWAQTAEEHEQGYGHGRYVQVRKGLQALSTQQKQK